MSVEKPCELSLIIPAYNESRYIAGTVERAAAFLTATGANYELIIVDDGSTDGTAQAVREHLVGKPYARFIRVLENGKNSGKGFSIRNGALNSTGEVVIFVDADLAYDLDAIHLIRRAMANGADLAIGSRMLDESLIETDVPLVRTFTGRMFNLLVRTFLFTGIEDTQCGFKGFSRRAVEDIFPLQTIEAFGFDVELLFIARRHGLVIVQVPVTLVNYRKESTVRVWRDSWRMLGDILRVRWQAAAGKYDRVPGA